MKKGNSIEWEVTDRNTIQMNFRFKETNRIKREAEKKWIVLWIVAECRACLWHYNNRLISIEWK